MNFVGAVLCQVDPAFFNVSPLKQDESGNICFPFTKGEHDEPDTCTVEITV